MKKALFAIGALSVMMAVSCNKESSTTEVAGGEPEVFEVKIGMSGSITSEIEPMSKSGENGEEDVLITGIDVWSCPIDGDSYTQYAYGLFDSTTDVTVKLLTGYKYRFRARTGKINCISIMWTDGDFYSGGTWHRAFLSDVENIFHYEKCGLGSWCPDNWYAESDLYFGETGEYTPTQGGTVTIDMERVSFCLSVSVQNLSEGVVKVKSDKFINDIVIAYPTTSFYSQYAMNSYGRSFRESDYYEEFVISAELTNADNVTVPLGNATIKVKRNHITKVKINANPPTTESQFSLLYSEDPVVDNEEDTYNIGGGETIDTPIE